MSSAKVMGSAALKDGGRECKRPLNGDQDRRLGFSTQSAAAARNEIEPKWDFCRHCSQT